MKANEYKRKLQTEPDKKFIDIDYEKEAAKIVYREGYFMTPKEKAKELINRYLKVLAGGMYDVRGEAKQCALICVDEVIPYTIEYQEHLV